jgi:hypothetical protein
MSAPPRTFLARVGALMARVAMCGRDATTRDDWATDARRMGGT